MNPAKQRVLLRSFHLVGSGMIGWALYGEAELIVTISKWVVFPALAVSGIWMWKQGVVSRWLKPRGTKPKATQEE